MTNAQFIAEILLVLIPFSVIIFIAWGVNKIAERIKKNR